MNWGWEELTPRQRIFEGLLETQELETVTRRRARVSDRCHFLPS